MALAVHLHLMYDFDLWTWWPVCMKCLLFKVFPQQYALNKPIVIGEFSSSSSGQPIQSLYVNAYTKGYSVVDLCLPQMFCNRIKLILGFNFCYRGHGVGSMPVARPLTREQHLIRECYNSRGNQIWALSTSPLSSKIIWYSFILYYRGFKWIAKL